MEDQALQGLSMILEDIRDPIKELEDQRSFLGEKSLLEHHDDATKPILKRAQRLLYRSVKVGVEEDQALQGLSMIPEDIRDPIKELEDQRSFAGETSLLEHHDDAAKPIVKRARRLLYRSVKVGVEDGRLFWGVFHCLDKQGNIIMYDAVEFQNVPGSDGGEPVEQLGLGMVLIPARCRTSCHVECSLDEKLDLLHIGS